MSAVVVHKKSMKALTLPSGILWVNFCGSRSKYRAVTSRILVFPVLSSVLIIAYTTENKRLTHWAPNFGIFYEKLSLATSHYRRYTVTRATKAHACALADSSTAPPSLVSIRLIRFPRRLHLTTPHFIIFCHSPRLSPSSPSYD